MPHLSLLYLTHRNNIRSFLGLLQKFSAPHILFRCFISALYLKLTLLRINILETSLQFSFSLLPINHGTECTQRRPPTTTILSDQIRSDQSLSHVRLFVTPWIAALQASLSITNSQSSPRLRSIESVMPSSHLILCRPLLLLPIIPPSIRVFSNESTLCMRWPKYWSFSFSIIPSKEIPGLISFRMDYA